jgi:hypothetical protein
LLAKRGLNFLIDGLKIITDIKSGFKNIKLSDLKICDIIVIIGSPNDKGQIEAKLIRFFHQKQALKENSMNKKAQIANSDFNNFGCGIVLFCFL